MKNFGFAVVTTGALAAAILGLATPASATSSSPALTSVIESQSGVDHLDWLDDIRPKVNVPTVDTSVQHREIRLPLPN
jgi:hypothetical protein